jgi:L-lactate utilization protein LutC
MTTQTTPVAEATLTPNLTYSRLASDAQIERTAKALKMNGFNVLVAENAADAKAKLAEVIPAGAEVFTSSSTTFIQLGLLAEIDREGGRYDSVRVKLGKMDPKTQNREMQKLGATPDYIVGSVHAVTETGSLLIASATGSQLAPYAASAGHVVWIVGTQKIVPNMDEAFKRLEEYTFPLEDQRAQKAYGMHSSINKVLIYNKEVMPARTTLIFIKENLGF